MCVCIVAARDAWLHWEQQFKQNHPLHTIQYQPITTTADNHQPSIINTHTIHNYNTRQQNYTHSCLCCPGKRWEIPTTTNQFNSEDHQLIQIIIIIIIPDQEWMHCWPDKINHYNQITHHQTRLCNKISQPQQPIKSSTEGPPPVVSLHNIWLPKWWSPLRKNHTQNKHQMLKINHKKLF